MLNAHLRRSDGKQQTLLEHSRTVSALCERFAQPFHLPQTAKLIGLMHDMGKATAAFQDYLMKGTEAVHPNHAPIGGLYACRRWFHPNEKPYVRATAQLVACCINGHHAGLADWVDKTGRSPIIDAMERPENARYYDEATESFFADTADAEELDGLFRKACDEIKELFPALEKEDFFGKEVKSANLGMVARLLLSVLVDADRWDSACFEYGQNPLTETQPEPEWEKLLQTFEDYRKERLTGEGAINTVRTEISDHCFEKADCEPGILSLSVPTGGGKTFSSLRFALRHAALNGQKRIFYIIPFNTILDQNAQDIREALNDAPGILEHHSNVVLSDDEKEEAAYKRLTERWDSRIILTSLVQFLNAFYSASNTDARRMHRLTNAVLIFDEIQALPKRCKTLFERAIMFLTRFGHCTVVLCTATQPKLSLKPKEEEIMTDVDGLYQRLQRVEYRPQMNERKTYASAAQEIAEMLSSRSVLAILNTKPSAWEVYDHTVDELRKAGFTPIVPDCHMTSESAIVERARESKDGEVLCVHMSTLLCPAHRKILLAWVKAWLRERKRVLCVSTALIEAGINVSFPVVIRSLTGIPSIVQAGGRANRSMEYGQGDVYIWDFPEENLRWLEDIQNGGNITGKLIRSPDVTGPLDAPETIRQYFTQEENYTEGQKGFPLPGLHVNLADLLADNAGYVRDARNLYESAKSLVLCQSFRTAYQHFQVIPQLTQSVIVPFGEGKDIIEQLSGAHDMQEEIRLLRRAQSYSVALFEHMFKRLNDTEHAIYPVGETGALALEGGYYGDERGVAAERRELELMIC